jgi:hypothetical protein
MRAWAARMASQLGGWQLADSMDEAVLIRLTWGRKGLPDHDV